MGDLIGLHTDLPTVAGRVIRFLRQAHGVSQGSLAAWMGVSRCRVHRIEAGREVLNMDHLSTICDLLAIEPQVLVEFTARVVRKLQASGARISLIRFGSTGNRTGWRLAAVAIDELCVSADREIT